MSYHYHSDVKTWASNKNETGADEVKHVTTNKNAAGIETKMENYGNARFQRRHYSEANDDDDVKHVTTKDDDEENELTAGIETKMENYGNARFQRRHYSEADDDEVTTKDEATKIKEAARVQGKERKHFPGTTTTIDFH